MKQDYLCLNMKKFNSMEDKYFFSYLRQGKFFPMCKQLGICTTLTDSTRHGQHSYCLALRT